MYPVLAQGNVTVLVNTHVNRVLIRKRRAIGVECVTADGIVKYGAKHEVILSGGGFNTPKTLMLSGIGDEAELQAHGIRTLVHSPEVGKNVQDHILHGGCLFEAPEAFKYQNSAANVSGYLKTDPSLELPDVSLVQIKDDRAVVDSNLRVNGIENLRIADSTIMPRIVAVPTMPACVLIGLRLADMLRHH
jgi:choline dehydrogenase